MEGSSNNEQGGDSNANDWRTQHEPNLRQKVIYAIVGKLKICDPKLSENDIKKSATKFEDRIYGLAKDKDDYLRKINRKLVDCDRKLRIVSSDNGAHTTPEAKGLSLPTSLPYTQIPTSQQRLPQSNLNVPDSSGLPTQVPVTVSAAQNLNIQMSEQSSNTMFQLHMNQQLPYMQLSQPMMLQPNNPVQQQQSHSRILQQHLDDDTQRFEAEGSLHQIQYLADQQNQPYQLQGPDQENPSSTSGGDWREETYQKIKALREKHILVLTPLLKRLSDRLQEKIMSHESIKKLRTARALLEQILVFLNLSRSSVSEIHRDKFSLCEEYILSFNENVTRAKMQQKQVHLLPSQIHQTALQSQSGQVHMSQSFEGDQNVASSSASLQAMPHSNANQIQTESQEHPPLVTLPPEPITERPIDRLIKAIQSSSPESLAESVSELSRVIGLTDRFAGSFHSIGGSRARLAEDLSEITRFRLQQGDTNPTKRFKRSFTSTPLDSTASFVSKVNNIEPSYAPLQEINEINGRLVETVVSICNEDVSQSEVTSGTVVKCSYVPVALCSTFKALYNSGHVSQIQPLSLLVPESYPNSPIILEKTLFDTASEHKYEDLSARTRSRFGLSMEKYSEPMSLKEIAKVWDECARATMLEYAERHGGGTFSSKYGRWESVQRG